MLAKEGLPAVLERIPEQTASARGETAERVQDVRIEVEIDVEGERRGAVLAQPKRDHVGRRSGDGDERKGPRHELASATRPSPGDARALASRT